MSDTHAHDAYLEAQVLTATPQKLRLLLLDAAIRFAQEALRCWDQGDDPVAAVAVGRCRSVVAELLSGISPESELGAQVAELYTYLYRSLIEIQRDRDAAKLQQMVRVLEEDRKTWLQLCEAMPEAPAQQPPAERGGTGDHHQPAGHQLAQSRGHSAAASHRRFGGALLGSLNRRALILPEGCGTS